MASLVTYTIAAAVVNTLTYGILSVLFVISMFLLGRQNSSAPPFKTPRPSIYLRPVVLASILLFLVVTAHWLVTTCRLFKAFTNPTQNPLQVIGDILSPSIIAEIALVFLSGALGDFIIIYRLWMIWGRSRTVTIFPIGSAIGECVSFIGLVCQLISARTHGADFFASWNHWIISACVFTMCTNIYCSDFIMWRLWVSRRRSNLGGGDAIMRAAVIAIESAALYTSWAAFFFVSYETDMGIYLLAGTVWPPITGIAIMLINVRVGLSQVQKSNLITAPQTSDRKFNHLNNDPSRSINIIRTTDINGGRPTLPKGEPGTISPV
ncbi:hypothetical protein BD779DRAFT_432825 [Infundibulicybe gibba]|nr:hypothetical protein BD779DRAFT_432825 [Infundibulicybe gibba]